MSKKITGVLLCMLMGVTLAACGNSSGTDNPKGQTTDQSEVSSPVSYTHLVLIKTDMLELFMEANEGRDLRDKGNVKAVTRNGST